MRRFFTSSLLVLSIAIASGCGGSDAGSPLEESLGYLPEDAPFVAVVETDTKGSQYKSLGQLVRKFPFGRQVEQQLKQQIEEGDVDFDKDVKPLLGNPFVVGAPDAKSLQDDGEAIGVIQAKDKGKLGDLLKREKAKEEGESNGAKLYKDSDGDTFAIKEDVLIVGGSRKQIETALAQRDKDDRLKEDTFNEGLDGLPGNSLVRVYGDLEAILRSDPETRDARKVKWVSALRKFGMTMSAKDTGVDVNFRVGTEGELSEDDLPMASGNAAPKVVEQAGELSFGLRDPSQVVKFAEQAGQAVNPSEYGEYTQAKKQIEDRLGVSIDDDLIGQITGDTAVNVNVAGKFAARAELKDSEAFEATLRKSANVLPSVAKGAGAGTVGLAKPKGDEGFYALAQPDGDSVVFGVFGDAFVIANDPTMAGRMSQARPEAVPGAKGALVMNGDAEQLVTAGLRQAGGSSLLGGSLFTGPLDDLTGYMSATPEGLTGKMTLTVD